MLETNTITEIPSCYSRVLFEHIPGMQGIWRVASSNRLKTSECPHRRILLSHAHYKLSAEYCRKRRLCIQNRLAGCVLSCTNTSREQDVPSFFLRKQGISIQSTSLWSEQCPSGIYSSGAQRQLTFIVRGYR